MKVRAGKSRMQTWTPEEFRGHRHALGWTQAETADALGLTVNQISAMENGRSGISRTIVYLFATYGFLDWPHAPVKERRGHPQREA